MLEPRQGSGGPARLSILLLQARLPGDPMAAHERACFVARTGLPAEAIVTHDLCGGPPTMRQLRGHDAVMVGGSGDFSIAERNLPHFDAFLDFLREVTACGHPMLASCFGFGGLVEALGGRMVQDSAHREVGTRELTLSDEGRSDELFGALPTRFWAQLGHKDRADGVGSGLLNLASSDSCPYQAVRVPDQPIWGTQFHPELDRATNLERFQRYIEGYGPADPEERAAAFAAFKESPESSDLLASFVTLVFGEK